MRREERENYEEVTSPKRGMRGRAGKGQSSKRFRNKEFARVTYLFVVLFLALMAYIAYFNIVRAKTIVNSPFNKRQETFAERVVRGSIVDKEGNILAQTEEGEDGTQNRTYPYGPAFAHVVGYSHPSTGSSGLESVENFELLTSNAFFGEKLVNEFKNKKSKGDTVVTTLDANLQQVAYEALGSNKGAVVVMESGTGKILSMISNPTYDPNNIPDNWASLNEDEEQSPLLNRATQGQYAPGSTFKIVTALEYMRQNSDYANYIYDCGGSITAHDTTINCFDNIAHGQQNLQSSIANSCNASFANIGLSLDKTAYKKTVEELLFNKKLPCVLDCSKGSFAINEGSFGPEVMMTAMGQGKTLVSPYHMALITSAIANGGVLMEPYLVEKVANHNGTEIRKNVPKSYKRLMSSDEAAQLKQYMRAVVEEGTSTVLSGQSYTAAGKTGTAEYSLVDGSKTHSWFIGFTNVDNPELVISVIVEGYDENVEARATPIAKQIMDSYYN